MAIERAAIAQLLRGKSLRLASGMILTSYSAQVIRSGAVFLLRAVLPAAAVGIIAAIQIAAMIYTTLTTGLLYRGMRDMPHLQSGLDRQAATKDMVAMMLEAALLAGPYLLVLYLSLPYGSITFFALAVALVYSFFFRLLGAVENTLSAMGRFNRLNALRLVRALEGPVGVLSAWIFGSLIAYLVGAAVVNLAGLVYAVAPFDWRWKTVRSARLLRHGGKYGMLISTDKMAGVVAQQIDSMLVLFLAGPATLAGYYLGVNLRGALLQVAQAIFWIKWSAAVREFDRTGADTYTTVRLTVMLGAGVLALMIALSGAGAVLIAWLIPKYYVYLPVIVVAAGAAVPYSLSTNLRSRHFLTESVHYLPILSILRIALFVAICLALRFVFRTGAGLAWIAWANFSAASAECIIYAALNARAMKRAAIFYAVGGICALAAVVTFCLSIAFGWIRP